MSHPKTANSRLVCRPQLWVAGAVLCLLARPAGAAEPEATTGDTAPAEVDTDETESSAESDASAETESPAESDASAQSDTPTEPGPPDVDSEGDAIPAPNDSTSGPDGQAPAPETPPTEPVSEGGVVHHPPAEPVATEPAQSVPFESLTDLDLDLVALMGTEMQVVTATKTAQHLDDAPAIIEVITAEDIRRWGYRNVGEALSHVAGFYVLDDHVLPNVSVRGVAGGLMSESGMIKVMIDGQSVSFRTTTGNWLGAELIPLSAIARIEIIRGPASALYGADAFLGVVNIITKTGEEISGVGGNAGAKILNSNLSEGNFLERHVGYEYDIVAGDRWGNADLLVAFGAQSQDRWGLSLPATSPTPRVPTYHLDSNSSSRLVHRGTSLYTKYRHAFLDERIHVYGSYAQSWIRRGGDFAHWAQLTTGSDGLGRSNGTVVSLQQRRAEVGAEIVAHPKVTIRARAGYVDGKPRADDRIEVASDLFYVRRRFEYRGFHGGADVVYTPMKKLQFIVGTEVYYDAHELEQPVRIDKATGSAFGSSQVDDSTNKNLINPGAYIQANWLAWDPYARLTAGVRYDWHNIYGSQVAGRGGIVSHWGKRRRVTTKLLYGSAFKAPSPLLLFATPLRPGDIVGNAKLDPQVVHAVESQIAWSRRKEFRISTGVTYSLLRNKAEFRPQGINITAQNVSSHHGLSWESRADFSHRKWLLGYVGFDLQRGFRVIDQEGYVASLVGRANVVHPLWIARGGLDFNVDKARLAFMTEAMVVGQRRAADANIVENGGDYDLDAYPVINAGIRTHDFRLFGRGLTRFSINGYNITNNTTPDPGFAAYDYPRLPLEVMVKVTHFHR